MMILLITTFLPNRSKHVRFSPETPPPQHPRIQQPQAHPSQTSSSQQEETTFAMPTLYPPSIAHESRPVPAPLFRPYPESPRSHTLPSRIRWNPSDVGAGGVNTPFTHLHTPLQPLNVLIDGKRDHRVRRRAALRANFLLTNVRKSC